MQVHGISGGNGRSCLTRAGAEFLDAQAGQQEDQFHLTNASRGLIHHLQTPELAQHKQRSFFVCLFFVFNLELIGKMVRPCVPVVSVVLSVISGTAVKN